MPRKYSSGRYGKAISDRSGQEFPYKEMVIEPGTGLFVHKSESDGKWNAVDQPCKYLHDKSDPQRLRNARPLETLDASSAFLQLENGEAITTEGWYMLPITP